MSSDIAPEKKAETNPKQTPEADSKAQKRFFTRLMIFNLIMLILFYGFYKADSHFKDLQFILGPLAGLCMLSLMFGTFAQFIIGFSLGTKPGMASQSIIAILSSSGLMLWGLVSCVQGAAWGRPLRIKGRQLHPELREGSDWTKGECPDASRLDEPTRQALAALWRHDAQKEHASVPAFSRISWMLAAVGAPAELMEWSHRAAMEEIDHARKCFALAAGYGGRSYTVEPMPDLLLGGLDSKADPIVTLATESLSDGCQLEDFNADVAGACALVCEEPATRAVLEQIAVEERSHADFSWALLAWLLERHPGKVRPAIEKTIIELCKFKRPTAVSWDKMTLVKKANSDQMLKHGRLQDERWGELWDIRLTETQQRLSALLEQKIAA